MRFESAVFKPLLEKLEPFKPNNYVNIDKSILINYDRGFYWYLNWGCLLRSNWLPDWSVPFGLVNQRQTGWLSVHRSRRNLFEWNSIRRSLPFFILWLPGKHFIAFVRLSYKNLFFYIIFHILRLEYKAVCLPCGLRWPVRWSTIVFEILSLCGRRRIWHCKYIYNPRVVDLLLDIILYISFTSTGLPNWFGL